MKQFSKPNKFGKKEFGKKNFSRSGSPGPRPEGKRFGAPRGADKGFPRKSFGGPENRGFAGEGSKPELFETTCASCGKPATIPFKPNGSKPIYCKLCFKRQDSIEPRSRPENRFDQKPRFAPRADARPTGEILEVINRKLDKIMRALKIE